MLHPLLAQSTQEAENLLLTGKIAAGILVVGKLMDLYNNYREGRDRKKHTEEFIKQTEILRSTDGTLKDIKNSQAKDTQTIALGAQRQGDMKVTIDRIDRGVRDLKTLAGIADTETTQLNKKDVKPN